MDYSKEVQKVGDKAVAEWIAGGSKPEAVHGILLKLIPRYGQVYPLLNGLAEESKLNAAEALFISRSVRAEKRISSNTILKSTGEQVSLPSGSRVHELHLPKARRHG